MNNQPKTYLMEASIDPLPPGPVRQMIEEFTISLEDEMSAILQWWSDHMVDDTNGGFYGRIDGHGEVHALADKGVILNTRILWTFSAADRKRPRAAYRIMADRAWHYLTSHFTDTLEGGIFWMLDHSGEPVQTKKQVYAQAFAIYAFSEYFHLTGKPEALQQAFEIFFLLERYSFDKVRGGYLEAFTREWQNLEDVRLSRKDDNAVKTMNTHLHVLEAYTNLYRVSREETVGHALKALIECFLDNFLDPDTYHLKLFFDENWNSQSDMVSYGHDIEASWLLVEAAEVIQIPELIEKCRLVAVKMARAILNEGIDQDGACYYEQVPGGHFDRNKHWWPQAEAVVGFLNAFQLSRESIFFKAAWDSWNFILDKIRDPNRGEWHWMVSREGVVDLHEDKAGPWKGPYHNVRACLEGVRRLSQLK